MCREALEIGSQEAVQLKLGLWRVGRRRYGGPGSGQPGERISPTHGVRNMWELFFCPRLLHTGGPMRGKFCSVKCRGGGEADATDFSTSMKYKAGKRQIW